MTYKLFANVDFAQTFKDTSLCYTHKPSDPQITNKSIKTISARHTKQFYLENICKINS